MWGRVVGPTDLHHPYCALLGAISLRGLIASDPGPIISDIASDHRGQEGRGPCRTSIIQSTGAPSGGSSRYGGKHDRPVAKQSMLNWQPSMKSWLNAPKTAQEGWLLIGGCAGDGRRWWGALGPGSLSPWGSASPSPHGFGSAEQLFGEKQQIHSPSKATKERTCASRGKWRTTMQTLKFDYQPGARSARWCGAALGYLCGARCSRQGKHTQRKTMVVMPAWALSGLA